jgi:hypothetical protein
LLADVFDSNQVHGAKDNTGGDKSQKLMRKRHAAQTEPATENTKNI